MIFRWLGKVFIILALILLSIGVYLWLSGIDMQQAGGAIWFQLHRESLQFAQVGIDRHLNASWLWLFIQNQLLTLPIWDGILRVFISFMIIGGFLLGIFKKPTPAMKRHMR